MTITEIRSILAAESNPLVPFPERMPDWAARHVFERRTRRTLTPFPAGLRVLNSAELRSFVKQPVQAVAEPVTTDEDMERFRRRYSLLTR